MITNSPKMDSIEDIVKSTMNGSAHFAAWSKICSTLDKVVPNWSDDRTKSGVENAVIAIEKLAERNNS